MQVVYRARSFLGSLRGFKLTLALDKTQGRPTMRATATGQFTYRGAPVPEASIKVVFGGEEQETRTNVRGRYSATIQFVRRGVYQVKARFQRLDLVVESPAVTVTVGYTLTIVAQPGGTTEPAPGVYEYQAYDAMVRAVAGDGYVFSFWTRDDVNVGSDNPYIVEMEQDHVLTAWFVRSGVGPRTITVRLTWTGFYPPSIPVTAYPVVLRAYLKSPTDPYEVNVYYFYPTPPSGSQQHEGPEGSPWQAILVFAEGYGGQAIMRMSSYELHEDATVNYDHNTNEWVLL